MSFVDQARISVKAGDGGKGCESFYSDKRTRYRRPDGGNGGKGGDVIFIGNKRMQTLLDYRFKQHYVGQRGTHGSSKQKKGRDGEDCILKVPVGTMIRDYSTGLLIKDILEEGQSIVVAKGGAGGIGNAQKKITAPPTPGEERIVSLELKIIADVGLIGFPNVGKSTLICAVSKVKSKIANYPFTTKQPILGIVPDDGCQFVVADLPGLIEGAHLGKGLGDRFLRHAERTKILVHVIDMAGSEGRNPYDDYAKINHELEAYSEALIHKHKIIVANKMDLPDAEKKLKAFKRKCKAEVIAISALENKGLTKLVEKIKSLLCHENSQDPSSV